MMTHEILRIGVAGLGTVGLGVCRMMIEKSELLSMRAGTKLQLTAVSARSSKDRGVDLSGATWFENAVDLATSDEVDVVLELIGGEDGIALDVIETALKSGKHVVTANKALMSKHGAKLAALAEKNDVYLACEAAVAGGIPILKALREGLAANVYNHIAGIMNGTCNYILTAMEAQKRDYGDVLKEAQALGYAESPPDLDVDGTDAAHKLSIVTALAHSVMPELDKVYCQGIRQVALHDIKLAKAMGFKIRLLGVSALTQNGEIEQRVQPCLIAKDSAMAHILGPQNALLVQCDDLGPAMLTGAGAGAGPTASSVMADVLDVATNRAGHVFGVPASQLQTASYANPDEFVGEFYIRVEIKDEFGALAMITKTLGDYGVSVDRFQQFDIDGKTTYVAIMTDATTQGTMYKVAETLEQHPLIVNKSLILRVEHI